MYSKAYERTHGVTEKAGIAEPQDSAGLNAFEELVALNQELVKKRGPNGQKLPNLVDFGELGLQVYPHFGAVKDVWIRLESQVACFFYQRFSFCKTWYQTLEDRDHVKLHIIAVQDARGTTQMLVPLCIKKSHFGTIVSFIGDGKADYLSPLIRPEFADYLEKNRFEDLWGQILATFDEKVDLVWLDRQPDNIIGRKNPFAQLASCDFDSSAHALDFPEAEDWAKCARMVRSKKTVANIERRLRQLAKLGEIKLLEVTDLQSRRDHMKELLALKISNLDEAGTLHRMNMPDVNAFYQALVSEPAMANEMCQFELRCGDKLAASVLGFIHNNVFYYQICAFNRQDFGQYSPGLVLLYQLFDWCFSRGIRRFDMTIGDEAYKNDWSNDTTRLLRVAVPYSRLGRLNFEVKRAVVSAKETVKATPLLNKMALMAFQL